MSMDKDVAELMAKWLASETQHDDTAIVDELFREGWQRGFEAGPRWKEGLAHFPAGKLDDWWLKEHDIDIEFYHYPDTGGSTIRIGPRDINFDENGERTGSGCDLTYGGNKGGER